MAVSAAALPALNAKLFEEEVGMKQRKFDCFCESLRTLVESQVDPLEREAASAVFNRCSHRVEANVKGAKEEFYARAAPGEVAKAAPGEVAKAASLQEYREKVGACAQRKDASLQTIVEIFMAGIQQLANELLPLLESKELLMEKIAGAREAVRARFNC